MYTVPSSNFLSTPLRSSRHSSDIIIRPSSSVRTRVSASLDISWSPQPARDDYYGGWAFLERPPPPLVVHRKKALPGFVWVGVGTSVAVFLAAIAHFSLSKNGYRFQLSNPFHALQGNSMPFKIEADDHKADVDASRESADVAVETPKDEVFSANETPRAANIEKPERVVRPVPVDSVQEEAVSLLQKLKIIEPDVNANDLCTRREYARWLVKANSSLERNSKHRINPSMLLSGTLVPSFDDVSSEDPDFEYIQALAEAGIVPSKLSRKISSSDLGNSEGQDVYFSPDRYICRLDLVNWKVQLDYELKPEIEKMSLTKVGFMDTREISEDVSAAFFMDFLAGDKGTLRKVFGQTMRLQPKRICTKAQAAVALTTGRMEEEIRAELLRLEAESISRLDTMNEIRIQLLESGSIQSFWDKKMKDVIACGLEVEKAYLVVINELEQEKVIQEKCMADNLRERVAMDCQQQLISSLKEEISTLNETLEHERVILTADKRYVQDTLKDMLDKREGLLDAKSILESEKEALRILRTWVEDEARKSQARAKVLEEVGRRWNWSEKD